MFHCDVCMDTVEDDEDCSCETGISFPVCKKCKDVFDYYKLCERCQSLADAW